MISVRGVFDGQSVKLLEPPPSSREASVIVTFLMTGREASGSMLKEPMPDYETDATRGGSLADIVDRARLVLGDAGRPVALQIDMADWSALMDWLEDVEDISLLRERFRERREPAITTWEDFEAELKADGLL